MKEFSPRSIAMAVVGLALSAGLMAPTAAAAAPVNVYRFYNSRAGAHFYTISDAERAQVQATNRRFSYEGVAYTMDDADPGATQNLYRFYNTRTGTHFYTANDAERDAVMGKRPYRYEGVAYKVSTTQTEGDVPVYRFYNRRVGGIHFYTVSEAERDAVIAKGSRTYRYEGVAYYVKLAPAAAMVEAPAPSAAVTPLDETALAQTILDGLKARYPRYLSNVTVEFGDANGYQAISYYTIGRIVVSPTHTATLQRILEHEIWHMIDWQDNGAMNWGEAIPPANMSVYAN